MRNQFQSSKCAFFLQITLQPSYPALCPLLPRAEAVGRVVCPVSLGPASPRVEENRAQGSLKVVVPCGEDVVIKQWGKSQEPHPSKELFSASPWLQWQRAFQASRASAGCSEARLGNVSLALEVILWPQSLVDVLTCSHLCQHVRIIWGILNSTPDVVQLLSHVQLFAAPRTAAHWASLSFTVSWSLCKLMSFDTQV